MSKVKSKIRRSLVVAGATGLAAVAASPAWQTRLVRPAKAQTVPPRTGEVKLQFASRRGQWGLAAMGQHKVRLDIRNQFAQGTTPVVHEVQVRFRLDHPRAKHLRADLISPDGHSVTLLDDRLGHSSENKILNSCSTKGLDLTFVDTDNLGEDFHELSGAWCPEVKGRTIAFLVVFKHAAASHLKGVFHTHEQPDQRLLPQFNGRPAVGAWYLKVYHVSNFNVNKVVREVDLTVYSRW